MKFEKVLFFAVFTLFTLLFIEALHHSVLAGEEDSIYFDECGACHFAYQPELLPEASWAKIMSGLENHFGDSIILLDGSEGMIKHYLKAKSAENSSQKHSMKIMGSLGRHTPLRITDIPYIRKKHNDISDDITDRNSIGSLSNCSACHISAEDGIYSEDDVSIPKN